MADKGISIQLLGKKFDISCGPGEEAQLTSAATLLEERLEEMQRKTSIHQIERLALLVALNLSNDLLLEKQKNIEYSESMDSRIRLLQATIEQALIEKSARLDNEA